MKNIHEILKGFGIEIPEDKKTEFGEAVKKNYAPIAELEILIHSDKRKICSHHNVSRSRQTTAECLGNLFCA